MPRTQPPRILHIASGDLWAGAEVQLYTLVTSLQAMGTNVGAVILNHGILEKRLRLAGVDVMVLDETRLNGFRVLLRLMRVVREKKPDIIHTHRFKENILGSLAGFLSGNIPTLRTVHGDSEHDLPWWKPAKRGIHLLDLLVGRYLQRHIIAVSLDMANRLQDRFQKTKILVIENGLNYLELQQSVMSESNPVKINEGVPFRVGLAGRLVHVKRVDLFLDAACIIEERHPEINIEYLVFGDGPLLDELHQRNHRNNMDHRLQFCGHSKNFPAVLNDFDALVMTSDHEGLPMVLLEAMALQVPVIAHTTGGISELLAHGDCGLLVNEHTAEGYAEAIYKLATDPELRSTLARRALQRLKDHYSATGNARKYLAAYNSINNRKNDR